MTWGRAGRESGSPGVKSGPRNGQQYSTIPQYKAANLSDARLNLQHASFAIREQRNGVSAGRNQIEIGCRAFHRSVEVKCLAVRRPSTF